MTVGTRSLAVLAAACAAALPAVIGVPAHLGPEPTAATSAGQPASETVVPGPAGTSRQLPGTTGTPHGAARDPVGDQQDGGHGRAVANGLTASGIPAVALRAYHAAADATARSTPSCGVDWALLAAIGMVESDHGQHAGSALGTDGTDRPPVYGPVLTRIADTDGGGLDGSTTYDRAVGPMQFIPGTWRIWAADGNGDGVADPQNVYDAALTAAHYLCAGGTDVAANPGLAVFRYNHSPSYVALVLALAAAYRTGGAVGIPGWGGRSGTGSGTGSGNGSGGGSGAGPTPSVSPSAPGSPSGKPSPTPTRTGSSPSPTKSGSSPSPTESSPSPTKPTSHTPSPTKSSSHPSTPPTSKSPSHTPSPSSSSPEPTTAKPTTTSPTPCPTASGGSSPSPSPSPTKCPDSAEAQGRALSAALLAATTATTPTPTPSCTQSPAPTPTPTSPTPTPSGSASGTPAPSCTPTPTPTSTRTPTPTPTPTTTRPRSPSPAPDPTSDPTARPPHGPTPRPTSTATPTGTATGTGTDTGPGSDTIDGPGLRPADTYGPTTRPGHLDERRVPDPVVAPTPGGVGWSAGRGPGGSAPSLPSDRPAPLPHVAAVTGFAAQYAAAGRSDLVALLPRAAGVHLRTPDHVHASAHATPARAPPERSPP